MTQMNLSHHLYNDKEDLKTRHGVLAIMLGFLLEQMTRVIATKPFEFNEANPQACNTKLEIERFLEEKYGHSLSFNIYH
jgi:hypothetical protein